MRRMHVRGRNAVSGLPQELEVTSAMLKPVLQQSMRPTIDAIRAVLDDLPTELLGDISKDGMHVAGGGSMLGGLDRLLRAETHIEVNSHRNALTAVAEGASRVLQQIDSYDSLATRVNV